MRFNKLIPELSVSSLKKSMAFYVKTLGFKVEYERPESGFAFLSFEGSQIMIESINSNWSVGRLQYPFGRGINLQIEAKDISKLIASLKKSRHPLFAPPKDNWYRKGTKLLGCREFLVMDPDGYLLRFSQDLGEKPIRK